MAITAPRGTQDFLPEQTADWQILEAKIRQICSLYGFGEIRTPMFESTELFLRGIGETTDVVTKEMYTFNDRGGRSMTRPLLYELSWNINCMANRKSTNSIIWDPCSGMTAHRPGGTVSSPSSG